MAITHNFADDTNDLGGAWSDEHGRPICTWTWDPASRQVAVACGSKGKREKLTRSEAGLHGEQLRKHLSRLALHLAEELNATKYEG
jgi:hypothetical protein